MFLKRLSSTTKTPKLTETYPNLETIQNFREREREKEIQTEQIAYDFLSLSTAAVFPTPLRDNFRSIFTESNAISTDFFRLYIVCFNFMNQHNYRHTTKRWQLMLKKEGIIISFIQRRKCLISPVKWEDPPLLEVRRSIWPYPTLRPLWFRFLFSPSRKTKLHFIFFLILACSRKPYVLWFISKFEKPKATSQVAACKPQLSMEDGKTFYKWLKAQCMARKFTCKIKVNYNPWILSIRKWYMANFEHWEKKKDSHE